MARRDGRRERPLRLDLGDVLGEVVRARRVLEDGDRRRVERRDGEVRGHDAPGSRREAGPERDELDRVEPCAVEGEDREGAVRVGGGVAVPGEVLQRREDAAVLEPLHGRRDEAADGDRLLAEAPHVDDGVVGVVVHVGDRGEDDVDPEGARRLGRRRGRVASARSRSPVAATAIAEGPKTRSGKRIPGPASRSAATRSGTFAFAARRWFRSAVSSGVESEPDDAADPLFGDEPRKVEVLRVVLRAVDAAGADHDDLPRLLAKGERGDGRGAAGEGRGRRGGRQAGRPRAGRPCRRRGGRRGREGEGRRRSGGPSCGFPVRASRRPNHRLGRRGPTPPDRSARHA